VGEVRREASAGDLAAARKLAQERGLDGPVADLAVARAADLTAYQDARLAARYLDLVGAAARAEAGIAGPAGALTEAVAAGFFHLLAYKDEYEVARLHLLPEFGQALDQAVPGGRGVRYRLHPPLLRAMGMHRKIAFPAPVIRPAFRVLRAMRHVRGTRADLFGYTEVRRTERRLAAEYEAELREVIAGLSAGYEHIKLAAVARYETERDGLRSRLRSRLPEPGHDPR
jgi:indolepyruvate ferredoxin oxidoreductase